MRIFIWNVNGLLPTYRNITLKHKGLKGFFEEHKADVVCVQEAKIPEEKLTAEVACVEGYESFWAHSRAKKGYSGVATWAKLNHSAVSAEVDFLGGGSDDIDQEGRVVMTDLGAFVLINVYVPNSGDIPERPRLHFKLKFLEELKSKMESLVSQGREVLVVGDFNIARAANDVHKSFRLNEIYLPEEVALMNSFTVEFTDAWRKLHPDEANVFTVWNERKNYRESNKGLRIDYALCSKGLADKLVSCEVIDTPRKWSDHAALIVEFSDIPPSEAQPACPLSSRKMKKFKKQKTIASMFAKKRPPEKQPTDVKNPKVSKIDGADEASRNEKSGEDQAADNLQEEK
ncbi:hypothetical protein BSKO_01833 [Bryopsis sp. KO-2023]|nr:hypothetical protein BSKO_01833 [Bryopsis sp. KO-2023]